MGLIKIDFSQRIPVFPLPNLVLLPGAAQPLHMFEPRYRAMTADALEGQSLIATALLTPGWEKAYHSSPTIHPIVCLGRIVAHEQTDEGNFNLILQGILRASIVHETKQGPYRSAMLVPLEDLPADPNKEAIQRAAISELFTAGLFSEHALAPGIRDLLGASIPIGAIADILAFTFLQDVLPKQRLLEERDPTARGDAMLGVLAELARQQQEKESKPWPPPMDRN